MNLGLKIKKLEEKIGKLENSLAEKKKAYEKSKSEYKRVERVLISTKEELEKLQLIDITDMLKSRSISIEDLKKVLMSDILSSPSPEKEKIQEDKNETNNS